MPPTRTPRPRPRPALIHGPDLARINLRQLDAYRCRDDQDRRAVEINRAQVLAYLDRRTA